MTKSTILLFLALGLISPYTSAYEVSCDGYDSDTGGYVYGSCTDGYFDGYDSDTSEYVYGDCQIGGSLDAYNSDTGEYVYGSCED